MLAVFFIPIIIINSGFVSGIPMLFALYITSGLGMAGIGMGVMHDAIHGSYSKKPKINKYLGYSLNLIGANANVWRIQHNVLHHTYTNIEEADDDINAPAFLRFSPHAKKYWLHKYQHLYVWLFYGLSTISWVTTKDYIRLSRYNQMGLLPHKNEYRKEIAKITAWKLLYYSYTIILPIIILPISPWVVLAAFLSMHFVTGLLISIIFQVAHIMPNTTFPLPDKNGSIHGDWTTHQLATTTNFSPKSRFFSWCIGGLNFQIEHHLLPNICHIHYKNLSAIVSDTAKEFEIPYHSKKTFASAVLDHYKMLKKLGQ
ncbi:acyl-CoA desaturase [Ascidiimonas aurantiaca]|uniref:fatty acid desaturase family protein n=1 Tax=Ascidiimonas aurantiaca TaxID=1685432 RepID=UPI0030EE655C